jgi:hypothetical protein
VQDKVQDNCTESPLNKGKVQDRQDKKSDIVGIYKTFSDNAVESGKKVLTLGRNSSFVGLSLFEFRLQR